MKDLCLAPTTTWAKRQNTHAGEGGTDFVLGGKSRETILLDHPLGLCDWKWINKKKKKGETTHLLKHFALKNKNDAVETLKKCFPFSFS